MQLKAIHGKRADISARKMIFYGIFGFLAAITFLLVAWFSVYDGSYLSKIPPDLENYLFVQRFLNSNLCFAFQDKETERVYPWVIDMTKFRQENLDNCYNAKDTNVKAYSLTLSYNNKKTTLTTKNWEGFLKKGETRQIFVYDSGNIRRAELFIEMQDAK